MKLRHYFLLLALGLLLLTATALFASFGSHPRLFYATEGFALLLLGYLFYFYRKTVRPFDTIVGGMELLREMDMTTSLAPSGLPEADTIVETINKLLHSLRSEHLQLSEQNTFLTLLIEASPMGVVQCDLEGNITSLNPAARQMMTPSVRTALEALPLGAEDTLRLSGEPLVYRISHLSFPDRGYQHPFYLIESLTSEVRRAERAAYERVIRMIAHEVNNSVGGIVAGLGTIENGELRMENEVKDRQRVFQSLIERLLSMSEFVTRFAAIVKIPQPQLQLCDLSEEVEACRPFLESLCHGTRVRLTFHLSEEAIPVQLDTALFQQVLINIVKNSVESISDPPPAAHEDGTLNSSVLCSPCREGVITIECCNLSTSQIHSTPLPVREGQGGGSGYCLIITDNGRGISPDAAQHLFTPFFSTKPQGQGLGLLLIRDILTAHGCTFTLQTDTTDHLTRFTIHFPVAKRFA